ncbi:hypothetical protein STANM309S_03793 [Streptomyces tanashiensis]
MWTESLVPHRRVASATAALRPSSPYPSERSQETEATAAKAMPHAMSTIRCRPLARPMAKAISMTVVAVPAEAVRTSARACVSMTVTRSPFPVPGSESSLRPLPAVLGEHELADVKVLGPESGLRIGEVELPHPAEDAVEAECLDGLALLKEPLAPEPERLGVVPAVPLVVDDAESGLRTVPADGFREGTSPPGRRTC